MERRQVLLALLVPLALILLGTTGYVVVEGWPWFDAFYMTVITLATVGFGETHPLSTAGRAFTAALILMGVFAFAGAITAALQVIISGELTRSLAERRKEKRVQAMNEHVVVCGYGRMGRLVCRELADKNLPFVVIDQDEHKVQQDHPGALVVSGDATNDDVLRRAGAERAKVLIVALPSDADNLFITMSARLMNDRMFIIARAEDPTTETKLKRAGANRVVAPYVLGGAHVVQAVLRPALLEFIDLATQSQHLELQLEEIPIAAGGRLAGTRISDGAIAAISVILVALQRPGDKMRFRPGGEETLRPDDVLIALGSRDALDQMQALAKNPDART